MDPIESAGYFKTLSAKHGRAINAIALEWKAADERCREFIFPNMGIETDSFGHIAHHERTEARILVGKAYDEVVVPLLARVPADLSAKLQEFWDEMLGDSKNPRRFWKAEWEETRWSIGLQVDACANREIARLAADPNTQRDLLWDVKALSGWCIAPFGLALIADARDAAPKGWSDSRQMWAAVDPVAAVKAWPYWDIDTFTPDHFQRQFNDFFERARLSQRRLVAALPCGLISSLAPGLLLRLGKSVIKIGEYHGGLAARLATPGEYGLRAGIKLLEQEGRELSDILVEAQAMRVIAETGQGSAPAREETEEAPEPATAAVGWSAERAKDAAKLHLKHNKFPGVRALAKMLGCPLATLADAIKVDAELSRVRDDHVKSLGRSSPVTGRAAGDEVKGIQAAPEPESDMVRADAMIEQLLQDTPAEHKEATRARFRANEAAIREWAEKAVRDGDVEVVRLAQDSIRDLIGGCSPNTSKGVRASKTRRF